MDTDTGCHTSGAQQCQIWKQSLTAAFSPSYLLRGQDDSEKMPRLSRQLGFGFQTGRNEKELGGTP